MRAVPDVNRVAATQEDTLVALAAVPAIQPGCRCRAVPHHEVDPARIHRNLVVDVAVIAVQRLCVGVAEDFTAHRKGALLLYRDGWAGLLTRSDAAGHENSYRAGRQKTHQRDACSWARAPLRIARSP